LRYKPDKAQYAVEPITISVTASSS